MLTTAIVLETSKGNFDLAIALGIILVGIAFLTTISLCAYRAILRLIDTRNATQTDANNHVASGARHPLRRAQCDQALRRPHSVGCGASRHPPRRDPCRSSGRAAWARAPCCACSTSWSRRRPAPSIRGKAFNAGQEVPLELRRRVTQIFQQPMLLRRSVEANVGYGLRLRGESDTQWANPRRTGGGRLEPAGAPAAHALRRGPNVALAAP